MTGRQKVKYDQFLFAESSIITYFALWNMF